MSEACDRARRLVDRDLVEGLSAEERGWVDAHLDGCAECAALSAGTARALQTVRLFSVQVPSDLAARTQFRVSLRTQEMGRRGPSWALWLSFALSWALGIYMAPVVWRGFEWAGRNLGVPPLGVTLAFGLWWAAPAALAGGIWMFERKRVEEE